VNRHLASAVGGSEVQCDRVARGLIDRGHEVVYVAVDGLVPADSPYPVRSAPAEPVAIAEACRSERVDVVYWRFGRGLLLPVARRLRRDGIPVVLAVAHEEDVLRWPRRPWVGGPRARAADAVARIRHRRSFRALRAVAGVASQREDQLALVPPGHPPDRVRLVRNLVTPVAAPAPWPHPRPYVAWVGNLKARKRPEVCRPLADALAPLGVDVLMAGALQDPAYEPLTAPDPARPGLRYVGRLTPDEVTALLAGSVCVAITYRPEGFSNVLLQAWALGRPTPTLGYDPDGLIAAEGLGGVAGEDVERFVALVRDLVRHPEEAAAAGARAAAVVRARFDPVGTLDELEGLLRRVAGA
jgi:glycosyltransferase involved in cell wall biosynthesis